MIDAFYLAAVPEPWTILGLKLRPFSLGHIILLHRIESAFVTAGIPTYDDLALSVFICSRTYEEALAAFDDKGLGRFMSAWARALTGGDKWAVRWGWRKGKVIDLASNCRDFANYISAHSKIPSYDFNPADFSQMDCPEVQLVKVRLMREMHFTESELLNRCWALCLWDYVTLQASEGKVKMIAAQAKEDALSIANELLAKIQAGKVKGIS